MSNNFNHSNLGDQFMQAVAEGLSTGDFRQLNILVNDTVSDAISQANRQTKSANNAARRNTSSIYESAREYEAAQKQRNESFRQSAYQRNIVAPQRNTLPATKTRNVGSLSSILYMTFGGIGAGTSAAVLLAAFICALCGFIWSPAILVMLVALLGGFIAMIRKGIVQKDRLNRMKRYLSLCAGKMYVNIADLSHALGKSTKYIVKDVKKMLQLGFFPEGHLDTKETCLMLDDATYREYLRVEKERKALALEHAAQPTKQPVSSTSADPELQAMIREGQDYIQKLHELNDLIPGEVISNKLYRMENLLREIFKRLEDDPTQMSQMHKLMNYYLPTTIKLLQSYAEFDRISAPGEEVISAKAEIEKTVDTINEAFTELLNKLFQATVFDATTDAQVLQTMLAKEGLTKNKFSEEQK